MKSLFCDLDLHLWGEYDLMRDLIACDLCGYQVLAEDAFRRGNTLPPMRPTTGGRPDWLCRPDLDTIQTRLPEPDPFGAYYSGIDWAMAWLNAAEKRAAEPVASQLRVGPGVADYLKLAAQPAEQQLGFGNALGGVPIVPTDGYRTGEWRMFDQYGQEMGAGQIEALSGMPADVKVITSPWLPDGVTAIAYSPTRINPEDPSYPLYGLQAVAIKDQEAQ